jgi:hypothetical protein
MCDENQLLHLNLLADLLSYVEPENQSTKLET